MRPLKERRPHRSGALERQAGYEGSTPVWRSLGCNLGALAGGLPTALGTIAVVGSGSLGSFDMSQGRAPGPVVTFCCDGWTVESGVAPFGTFVSAPNAGPEASGFRCSITGICGRTDRGTGEGWRATAPHEGWVIL